MTRLAVKYQHLNKILEFSDLSQFPEPDKAFETFVNEISAACWMIGELRELSKTAATEIEKQEVFDLLHQVVQATAEGYYPNRTYAVECAQAQDEALRNPDRTLSKNALAKISFETSLGPVVRELGGPISSLKGCAEIIQGHSLQDDKNQGILSIIDRNIGWILKVMGLCRRHLRGEINMWEYTHEEIQALLD